MYGDVFRDAEYVDRLIDFIRFEYRIDAKQVTSAKRGFYGETWCLESVSDRYFIKIVYASEHKEIYKRSFHVVRHLCDNGIDFISKIVTTNTGNLYSYFDDAIVGVFHWIDGDLTENDDTKIPEYRMLAKVYTVPTIGLDIPREQFSDLSSELFYLKLESLRNRELKLLLEKNRSKIEHRAKMLKYFADLNQNDTSYFFITHGDAGGNLIVSGDKHFIVDWDTACIAPPERDAWVMCSKAWAREAFQSALHRNGISYTLQTKRLAYYCYEFFFYYLNAFLDASASLSVDIIAVEEYLDGWIEDSINYCERHYL